MRVGIYGIAGDVLVRAEVRTGPDYTVDGLLSPGADALRATLAARRPDLGFLTRYPPERIRTNERLMAMLRDCCDDRAAEEEWYGYDMGDDRLVRLPGRPGDLPPGLEPHVSADADPADPVDAVHRYLAGHRSEDCCFRCGGGWYFSHRRHIGRCPRCGALHTSYGVPTGRGCSMLPPADYLASMTDDVPAPSGPAAYVFEGEAFAPGAAGVTDLQRRLYRRWGRDVLVRDSHGYSFAPDYLGYLEASGAAVPDPADLGIDASCTHDEAFFVYMYRTLREFVYPVGGTVMCFADVHAYMVALGDAGDDLVAGMLSAFNPSTCREFFKCGYDPSELSYMYHRHLGRFAFFDRGPDGRISSMTEPEGFAQTLCAEKDPEAGHRMLATVCRHERFRRAAGFPEWRSLPAGGADGTYDRLCSCRFILGDRRELVYRDLRLKASDGRGGALQTVCRTVIGRYGRGGGYGALLDLFEGDRGCWTLLGGPDGPFGGFHRAFAEDDDGLAAYVHALETRRRLGSEERFEYRYGGTMDTMEGHLRRAVADGGDVPGSVHRLLCDRGTVAIGRLTAELHGYGPEDVGDMCRGMLRDIRSGLSGDPL